MSYSNYEQTVIINGHRLLGVQSVGGNYGISEKPVRVAGVGFIDALIESPLQGNFSISRKMVGADPLIEKNSQGKYIYDEAQIEGVILYDNDTKGFGFTKGRVSRYSVSCSVGDIPEIQTEITVYGSLGKDVMQFVEYIQNTSSVYYPYNGQVNLGVRGDRIFVTNAWNAGTLKITDDQYNKLPEQTASRKWTSLATGITYEWLELGKDAFVGFTYAGKIQHPDQAIKFPDQSSMRVTVTDFTIDAITDFSYSRAINTAPVYALPKGNLDDWNAGRAGTKNLDPIQIDTQYPIEVDINFTIIADEYEIREIKNRIQAAPKSDVSIEIFDAQSPTDIINSYVGENVRLISESIGSTVDGEMTISLTYKGYETRHNIIT